MRGVTLVEMAVVLLLLGLLSGVSALAMGRLRPEARSARSVQMEDARRRAIHLQQPVTVAGDRGVPIRFLPDGRAIGVGMDVLTGHPSDAR